MLNAARWMAATSSADNGLYKLPLRPFNDMLDSFRHLGTS
jgi:hypothetical protein